MTPNTKAWVERIEELGHDLMKDGSGEVDMYAFESADDNGPMCRTCLRAFGFEADDFDTLPRCEAPANLDVEKLVD